MKIAGIIAEYNPFHSGHAYHIRRTREITGCDYVVVCMAGSFVQRGDAARIDKFTRTRAALLCGADAVFELPALYAVRTADVFARGGVEVLGGIGCDVLSFGCETDEAGVLECLAALRTDEPDALSALIRKNLGSGMTHARARGEAISEYAGIDASAPNLILGTEYLRAIREGGFAMEASPVRRVGAYHGGTEGYACAGAIREMMKTDRRAAADCVPDAVRDIILCAEDMHPMDDILLHTLRGMTDAQIAELIDVSEGLERRVLKCAQTAASRGELIDAVKCKRYTYARISRLCTHAALHMTRALADRHPHAEYARLTAMRGDAGPLLKELDRRSRIPIVSDAAQLRENEIFRLECRATDLRALMCDAPDHRRMNAEFTQKFIVV